MSEPQPSVVVLFNHTGEDEYERLEHIDPASLDFEPEYDIRVTTVLDEYKAVAHALRREGLIFNLIEHFHDDAELEPAVAALFDLHEVAYTGATPFALSLCYKKGLTKQVLLQNGVPTPRFVAVEEPRLPKRSKLRYPIIVKPAREDASSGVERESVVYDEGQLQARLQYVFDEYGIPILVEEFIDGEELHVPILGNDPPEVLPPIAWDFTRLPEGYPHIITFAAKWNPLSEAYHRVHSVCPPDLPKRILRKVEKVSLQAYEVTGCRDYARLDVRIGKDGNAYVLEINPNPDLTEGVSFMESAEVADYTFGETLAMIVDMALERKEEGDEVRRLRLERQKQKREPVSPEGLRASLQRLDDKAEEKAATAAEPRKKASRKTKKSDP
jgi:D-alanine-D-alanine ligase